MKKSTILRIIALTLCFVMTLPLFACNDEEVTTQETSAPETEGSDGTTEPDSETDTTADTTEPDSTNDTDEPDTASGETSEPDTTESDTTEPESAEDETTSGETSGHETSTPETSEPEETYPKAELDGYGNGDPIENAGISWADDAFASKENTVDSAAAVTKTASEMLALLKDKNAMAAGEVYKVTEALVLTADTSYYGNMAALIAEGGVILRDVDNVIIKDLIIKGNVSIENSADITFNRVEVKGGDIAISIDAASSYVRFESFAVSAKDTAVMSAGANVSLFEALVTADKAIVSSGSDFAVQNCRIDAGSAAILSTGAYAIVRENTITANKDGVGVSFGNGSYNGIITLNRITDVSRSIEVTKGYNCVVLLNSAIYIGGTKNTNLYVVENKLGGIIELNANQYLLCDRNTFAEDGKVHALISRDNTEINGDNLHDVDARAEHGANEELLPHTNKDLFIAMERRKNVTDLTLSKDTPYVTYVTTKALDCDKVIIPPGAYAAAASLGFAAGHENVTVYAYGVYQEKSVAKDKDGLPTSVLASSLGTVLSIGGDHIHIHGLTMGYDFQSSGQVYVLEKFVHPTKGNCIKVVTSAGYVNGFSGTNDTFFAGLGSGYIHAIAGDTEMGLIGENGTTSRLLSLKYVETDEIGVMTYKMEDIQEYNDLEKGDVIVCRLGGDNSQSLTLNATDILLRDCVLYGYSSALGIVANTRNSKNIRLERFHNTSHSAPVISKRDYQWYKFLEREFGLTPDGDDPIAEGAKGLEVYIDENGNYRGGLPRYSSVDATHISGAAEGVSATSSIFEHMCDDGTNQRASSARIAGYKNNGDGTTTLYIKGSLVRTYFNLNIGKGLMSSSPTGNEIQFKTGDTIFAYASEGHTLIEAPVISDSSKIGELPDDVHLVHSDGNNDCICDEESCKALLHCDNLNTKGTIQRDCRCDNCGITVHTNYDTNDLHYGTGTGKCRQCGFDCTDADQDHFADNDKKAYVLTQIESNVSYDPATSTLSYKMYAWNHQTGGPYTIEYRTIIKSVLVNTSDVDFDAFEGRDLTDNDFFMYEKILCDNLSLNSAHVTFDNVLMREYRARGVLAKTYDVTVKNCTFRNVLKTGVLLSIETSWGESTVPKDITIENCWFDHTGDINTKDDLHFCGVSLMGLGDITGKVTVSERTLPARNINIIGNKFDGVNSNYVISISAAKDITIKDNVFILRDKLEDDKYDTPRVLFINGAMDIEVSGNTFENIGDQPLSKLMIGWNYKNLHGSDVDDVLPQDKDEYPTA